MSRRRPASPTIDVDRLGPAARRQVDAFRMAVGIKAELEAERRHNADPEEEMQIVIARALNAVLTADTVWFHVPNGKRRSKAAAGTLKAMGVRAGIPDLLFAHAGRLHGIELKVGRRPASTAQKDCHAALARAGVPIAIARSLDDVLRALATWGIPTRIAPGSLPTTASTRTS